MSVIQPKTAENEKNWVWFKADFLLAMLSRASPDPKAEIVKAKKPKGKKK